jgi:metal-responsive CopG/Arc/MetJ family transcriptional regulator
MTHVKTAISLPKALFDQADALARRLKISRSRLLSLALEEYLQHHTNKQLRERIDAAYGEEPDPAEQALRERMLAVHREIVEGEW